MRTLRRMRFLTSLAVLGLAGVAPAAELIKVPDGVVVRSLFDWEGTNGLEVSVGGVVQPGSRTPDGAEYAFSKEALCDLPGYRNLTASGALPFVDMQHLCGTTRDGEVTFALIADTQELHDEHRKTAELLAQLAEDHPEVQFVVTAGDIVDRGNEAEWTSYRKVAEELYTYRLPIVPVLGNHEYFDDNGLTFWTKVYSTEKTKLGYYVLDLGPAALIVLNSNVDRMSEEGRAAQTAWLKTTLDTYAAADKPMLVTYHHPAYATGVGTIFIPVPPQYAKANWLPLFQQYGVKLVMNGHEHIYERLLIEGVRYVNAGPAGGTWGRAKPFSPSYTQKLIKEARTVTLITVTAAGNVALKTYSPDHGGALIDEDSF